MFEFFIALFGGIYWLIKMGNARQRKKDDIMDARLFAAHTQYLSSQFGASQQLEDEIRAYVNTHFAELLNDPELCKDLRYIYGESYKQIAQTGRFLNRSSEGKILLPHYSVKDCMVYLILAKEHRKMAHFALGYNAGALHQLPCSLKMFECINKYIDEEECELTLVPSTSYSEIYGDSKLWHPQYRWVKPAVYNVYAKYPEAHSSSWSQYY